MATTCNGCHSSSGTSNVVVHITAEGSPNMTATQTLQLCAGCYARFCCKEDGPMHLIAHAEDIQDGNLQINAIHTLCEQCCERQVEALDDAELAFYGQALARAFYTDIGEAVADRDTMFCRMMELVFDHACFCFAYKMSLDEGLQHICGIGDSSTQLS